MQKQITKKPINKYSLFNKTAWLGAVLLLILDRALKMAAIVFWQQQPIKLIGGWFLGYNLNKYLAFSLPWTGPVLSIVLSIVVIGLIIETIITLRQHRPNAWGWLLLLIGSTSNLYDRLVYGGVIDYLATWWTFLNLADILIVSGLMIIIIKRRPS